MTAQQRLVLLAMLVTVTALGCEYLPQPTTKPWLVVLGDAERFRPGEPPTPPSTQLQELPEPATTTPPAALCHAEHRNAVAVSEAIRHHFPAEWWATFCRIAWCESTFDPGAYNRSSGATGLFQIMGFWHDELDVDPWTIWGSAALARYVFDEQGPTAWSCY